MLKIGITGGIGSGKTTICKVFELLGIPVFYADDEAKKIMLTDELLIAQIKENFGVESYFEDQTLNRKHIAAIVFKNDAQLQLLNSFVHPAVFRAMDNWVTQQKAPYVLKEAALLFESGSYQMCDKSILVTAPLVIKMDRVMLRDGVTKEQVEARMDKQLSDEVKSGMADFLISNNESESVILQVMALHNQFIKK